MEDRGGRGEEENENEGNVEEQGERVCVCVFVSCCSNLLFTTADDQSTSPAFRHGQILTHTNSCETKHGLSLTTSSIHIFTHR